MFGLDKISLYAIIGVIIVSIAFFGYFEYSQYRFEKYQTQIATNAVTIDSQKKAIEQNAKDAKTIAKINSDLTAAERASTERIVKLTESLSKLDKVAITNPAAVEKLINKASSDRNRCFALATGATPDKNETNDVCPQLLVNHD